MGLLRHQWHRAVTRPAKRKLRRKVRQAARRMGVTCSSCKKRYSNPLTHTCTVKTDFRQRKRAAAREAKRRTAAGKRKAATARRRARRKRMTAERRAREKARKAAARMATPRPARRGDSHEPGTCGNRDCPRYGCKSYWQGMDDCPLPHEG